MSHTKRNKPLKQLTAKEEKLVKKNKFKHGLDSKTTVYEDPNFSQSGKKEAKKEKHHKQRIAAKKEIEEIKQDE
jgi:hypothetical protein